MRLVEGFQDVAHADGVGRPGQNVPTAGTHDGTQEAPSPQAIENLRKKGAGDVLGGGDLPSVEGSYAFLVGQEDQCAQRVLCRWCEDHVDTPNPTESWTNESAIFRNLQDEPPEAQTTTLVL